MKKLLILTLVVFAFSEQAQSEKSNKSARDKQSIEKLINEYGDAIKSASVEKVLAAFIKDGVLISPGAPTATGQEQLKGTYEYVFGALKLDLKFTILEVTIDKNTQLLEVNQLELQPFLQTTRLDQTPTESCSLLRRKTGHGRLLGICTTRQNNRIRSHWP